MERSMTPTFGVLRGKFQPTGECGVISGKYIPSGLSHVIRVEPEK